MASNKEIVALSDFEHVLLRSTMYIGSVEKSEERIPIARDGKITLETREISVGFYKLMTEILDNAFDEAKRMKGAMKSVEIHFDSKDNSVEVIDSGGGFLNGSGINEKTKLTNVASAMTMLRAGSNFYNDNSSEHVIGTNGVGASIVNMLSDRFSVTTVNSVENYQQSWDKFVTKGHLVSPRKDEATGTRVKFVPRKDTFKGCSWDRDYVHTMMIFRQFLKKTDPVISDLEFVCIFDGQKLDLDINFLPAEYFKVDSKHGSLFVWESYSQSTSVSFVNGAICGGIHQRIIGEWLNEAFDSQSAGKFYEVMIVLNLPPKMVRFGDQNKTRFVTSRGEITPVLEKYFYPSIKRNMKNSPIYEKIVERIAQSEQEGDVKNLRNTKRAQRKKISEKYFPPSGKTKNLFIVEGGCVHEDLPVLVMNEKGIEDKSVKDVKVGDSVLTHKNRWREVTNVSKKISKGTRIMTSEGEILSGEKHPWFVYDTSQDKFFFLESKDIDPMIHKLAKSHLAKFSHLEIVKQVRSSGDEKYPLRVEFEKMGTQSVTETHKFCVYEESDGSFQMRESRNLKEGECVAVFEF